MANNPVGGAQKQTGGPVQTMAAAASQSPPLPAPTPCALSEVSVGAHFESTWFAPDGRTFAVGGQDKVITLYDVATGQSATAAVFD
eukprot:SAG31_NODE_27530_length_424_cov_1.298462_1_plen_85_part_10